MAFSQPVPPRLLRQFKAAGRGQGDRHAGERIILAVLAHFRAEITVLEGTGANELFRVGAGQPRHGVYGVHVHPLYIQWPTWDLRAGSEAVAFLTAPDFNMYLGLLLQALELGRYRVGFPKE